MTTSVWRRLQYPMRWKVTTRRAFLLTFPLSLPLWIAALALVALLRGFGALLEPFDNFWNARPRRRVGYHSYNRRSRPDGAFATAAHIR